MGQDGALPKELRRTLYYRMRLMRMVEERVVATYPLREMRSPPHLCMGHEAVAVGVCAALRPDDLVFPYYRSHGWYLAKGGNLKALIAELFGRDTGCSRGWGGSMHVIDLKAGVMGTSAIVGGTIAHGLGAALAFRMQGRPSVVAVSFGDGATEEGIFHETLNFAALRKLPVLFVCENNLYSTNTHIRYRQAQPDIFRRAESYGLPGVLVDGNDVRAVLHEAERAIARARRGEGPTLVECRTYRLLAHCGVTEDLDLGYRTVEEIEAWRAKEPLIQGRTLVDDAEAARIRDEIARKIDEAFAYARSSPYPDVVLPEDALA